MRIVVDAYELGPSGAGVSRVVRNLLPLLASLLEEDRFFIMTREIALPFSRSNCQQMVLPSGKRGYFRWQNGPFWRACLRLDPQLIISFNYTLPIICPWPSLLFVHDISLVAHPEWFPRKTARWRGWLLKRSLHRADQIIVPSLFTEREIVSRLKIRREKLRVVYYGLEERFQPVSEDYRQSFKQSRGLADRRIIGFLGSIFRRRHIPLLVAAVESLRSEFTDICLYIIGQDRTYPPEPLASLLNREWIRWDKFLPEVELPLFYAACDIFAYLSEYEGFGFPPLEALACGSVPVVFNRSSLGEILADLAFLVDEIKPEAVCRALREALINQERREEIRKRFETRRQQFSWPRAASDIAELISKFKRKMT